MAVQAQDIFESSFHCRLALDEDIDVQDNKGVKEVETGSAVFYTQKTANCGGKIHRTWLLESLGNPKRRTGALVQPQRDATPSLKWSRLHTRCQPRLVTPVVTCQRRNPIRRNQ